VFLKKYLVGLVFGFILSIATMSYAGSEMIGKMIDSTYPLIIDGKRVQGEAISIDGTSYIPVRSAAEIFGYKVDFNNDQIILKKDTGASLPVSERTSKSQYKIKSAVINVIAGCNDMGYEQNGIWFLPVGVFKDYLEQKPDEYYVTLPGNNPVKVIRESGRALVNISDLGLKPVIKGEEAWLEWK
jgi:hypothetical protein